MDKNLTETTSTTAESSSNNKIYIRIRNFAFYIISAITSLWILGAFFYLSFASEIIQFFISIAVLTGLIFAFTKLKRLYFSMIQLGFVFLICLLFIYNPAKNNRHWVTDQEFMPEITIKGDQITIKNFRFFRYRSNKDFDAHWETRTYNLNEIVGVDFIVEPFSDWRGLAHTFLTFSFANGEHVSISVEIRREQKESYSVLAGFYRNYELIYIIGDERDLIGLRTNIRKDPVHLYPVKARKEQVKKLFLSMLQRANQLSKTPEYYNSLFNTCSTNISQHLFKNFKLDLGFDIRITFPGYADELAFELGLINTDQTLEEARKSFLINGRSTFLEDGKAWSKQIRNNLTTENTEGTEK